MSVTGKCDEFSFVELKVSAGHQLEMPNVCLDIEQHLRKKVWNHGVQQKAVVSLKCKFYGSHSQKKVKKQVTFILIVHFTKHNRSKMSVHFVIDTKLLTRQAAFFSC